MPKGRQICEYALAVRSANRAPGPRGTTVLSMNLSGPSTRGACTVVATATLEAGLDGGLEFQAVTLQENGAITNSGGRGFCRAIGDQRWATKIFLYADREPIALQEGLLDLAAGTWTGATHEWISQAVPFPQPPGNHAPAWTRSKAA